MHILDRYLLGEFLKKFFSLLFFVAVLLVLKEVLGRPAYLHATEWYYVVVFFSNKMMTELIQVVPICVILGMMFSIGALAKRKEILAMHASGLSYNRLALPLVVPICFLTLGVFLVNEFVVPDCWRRARRIEQVEIKGRDLSVITMNDNITTKGKGDRFYTMESFDSEFGLMERPTITDVDTTRDGHRSLRFRLEAQWAEYLAPAGGGAVEDRDKTEGLWRFHHYTVLRFDEDGKVVSREGSDDDDAEPFMDLVLERDLNRFLSTNRKEKEMDVFELYEFSRVQGERNRGPYYLRLRTAMWSKMAFPFSVFFLGLLGYTFAVQSSIRSLAMEFGLAILCIALWYTFFGSAPRLGRGDFWMLPAMPFAAAWYGNALFLIFLVWQWRKLERVPLR